MAYKRLVLDQLKLNFEGIFDLNGLYRTIDGWFYEKGYDKYEKKNYEQVLPTGKDVEIELLPWKKITDYFKIIVRVRAKFVQIKDVEVQKDGVTLKMQQGRVMFIFDGYLVSDYDNAWESRPMLFFIRTIFDKYIFRKYTKTAEKWLVNDLYQLHGNIQRFLNIYRYEKHV